jgi:5-formyltetrahydrofolate cyclo-ligase
LPKTPSARHPGTGKQSPQTHQQGKSSWRATLRQRRRQISPGQAEQAARLIVDFFRASAFWQTQHIGVYLANDGELDPMPLALAAQAAGKQLYLPVLNDDDMQFRAWTPGEALIPNRFGIGEPPKRSRDVKSLDLLVMPLVGWTGEGFRLGMGGGYYDRFLASQTENLPLRLGLGYECQREDGLQVLKDSWDVELNALLSEAGLYRFTRDS